LPHDVIAAVLKGGESVCADAGIPLAGGHSIDSVEPIYGLVAIGVVDPRRVKRNAGAQAGDVLILGKPLGVGVLSAALKKDRLDANGYAAMIGATTKLNRPGAQLAGLDGVHALTDITGFGLLGHTLELARGSKLTARVRYADLPWLPGVVDFAEAGVFTGASGRNWDAYGKDISLPATLQPSARTLLTDPQTSGGLLVSCSPEAVDDVLALFHADGFGDARVIGEMVAGEGRVEVI
jgi:selenide,water dikinase